MKIFNKKTALIILIFSVIINAAGCGKSKAAEAEKNTAKTVRIMSATNYFPFIIADEKGFFKEEFGDDVEVTYTPANSGSMIMETMTAGEVDFAGLGDMPVIQARVNGLDVKVISSLFTSTTGYQLIAAKDSGINDLSDLKGKKIAVMSGSTNHKLFLKYLEAAGLSEDDVEIVYLKNQDQLAAFVGNNVDAAVTQVPTSTTIEEETGAYEVVNAEGYDNILTVIVGNNEFMQENPEYATKLLKAIIDATGWIENNEEEAIQIVADVMGDTCENMELYYNTRKYEYSLDDNILSGLSDTISYLYDQKTISKKPSIDELTDDSYIKSLAETNP